MKKTTILLTTLLTASVIGNAYQYKATEPAQETTITQQAVTDDPDGDKIFNPIRGDSDKVKKAWFAFATFAIQYEVDEKPGTPGGATVTIYYSDSAPSELVQKEKPTVKDVFWAPPFASLPGVKKWYVVDVQSVQRGKANEE